MHILEFCKSKWFGRREQTFERRRRLRPRQGGSKAAVEEAQVREEEAGSYLLRQRDEE